MANVPPRRSSLDTYPASEVVPRYDEQAELVAVRDNLFDNETVDKVFQGRPPGVQLLAVTNQRIMMVERTTWDGRCALTSVPFGRVSAVSLLSDDEHPIDEPVALGIRVQSLGFVMELGDAEQTREAHDLITWALLH
jgi:hypothetical protein